MCIRDRIKGVSDLNSGAKALTANNKKLTSGMKDLTFGLSSPVSYTHLQIKGLLIEKDSVRTKYPCRNVIFAIGHSARDTFYMLHEKKLFMTPKAFAIGVRVEHPAYLINESQYGKEYPEELPTASYKLTHPVSYTHLLNMINLIWIRSRMIIM